MLRLVNLKEGYSVEQAIAILELEIESAKKEGVVAIKVLHGYGSHGRGGVIRKTLLPLLSAWKRSKFIKDFFGGDKWNMFDEDAKRILMKDKSIFNDCDISNSNPGITIIEINWPHIDKI